MGIEETSKTLLNKSVSRDWQDALSKHIVESSDNIAKMGIEEVLINLHELHGEDTSEGDDIRFKSIEDYIKADKMRNIISKAKSTVLQEELLEAYKLLEALGEGDVPENYTEVSNKATKYIKEHNS